MYIVRLLRGEHLGDTDRFHDDGTVGIAEVWYGSCGGCDRLEAWLNNFPAREEWGNTRRDK